MGGRTASGEGFPRLQPEPAGRNAGQRVQCAAHTGGHGLPAPHVEGARARIGSAGVHPRDRAGVDEEAQGSVAGPALKASAAREATLTGNHQNSLPRPFPSTAATGDWLLVTAPLPGTDHWLREFSLSPAGADTLSRPTSR